MNTLFGRMTINDMERPNRFIRFATWEGICDEDGHSGDRHFGIEACCLDVGPGGWRRR